MSDRTEIEEEGGEGYFASVSDLMVGVLFVFLLMLTVLALNFRNEQDVQMVQLKMLQEAQAVALQAQQEARRQQERNKQLVMLLGEAVDQLNAELRRRQALREQLLSMLATSLDAQGVKVQIDDKAGILRLSGDVLFNRSRSEFTEEAAAIMPRLGQALARTLPCYSKGRPNECNGTPEAILETVLIEGHTDRLPWGTRTEAESQSMNDELSAQRALRVFQTLRRTSPILDALRNQDDQPLFGISGYGERRPLGGDDARDRRIDVRFVLSSRTSDELEKLKRRIDSLLEVAR